MQSKLNVVYVRRVGPYGQVELVPRLFEKLVGWAGSRELLAPDTRFFCIAHDNPGVTSQDNLRLSVCLTVPPGTQPEGDVGATTIPGGKCAVARFDIEPFRVAEAWEAVCGAWLPQSGFQLDDRLLYEELVKPPDPARAGKVILDICLPIRAL